MAPIVLPLLQGLFLLLLYLFVWRIARAILRDLRASASAPKGSRPPATRPAAPAPPPAAKPPAAPGGGRKRAQTRANSSTQPQRVSPSEIVVHRAGSSPRVLPLDGQAITFGRAAPATIVLDDPYVSDQHARIAREGDAGWVVTDLGSTNGTFLNQVKVTRPTPLAAGDQLGIGKTTVEVRR